MKTAELLGDLEPPLRSRLAAALDLFWRQSIGSSRVQGQVAALVKADSGLDSAIIAPTGEIVALAVTDPPARTTLVAAVPLGRADAPLIRLGDWLGWLCIVGMGGFIILDQVTGRQVRRAGRAHPATPQEAPRPPASLPT